jgi:hypothetical protein
MKLTAKQKRQEQALYLYETNGQNIQAISEMPGMPTRQTLYVWRDAGHPAHITGGQSWDDFLYEKHKGIREGLPPQIATVVPAQDYEDVDVDDLGALKARTMQIFNTVAEHFINHQAEIKLADANTAIKLYLFLDGEQKKQIEFAEGFAEIVLGAAAQIMDEQQYARFNDIVADAIQNIKMSADDFD